MNVLCTIGFAAVLVAGGVCSNVEHMVDGDDSAVFSFMVSLRDTKENAHFCGGTLVSASVVLTAAHCLSSFSVGEVWIGGGNLNKRNEFEIRNVSHVDRHEFYGQLGNLNDIALLHLSSPSTKVSVAINGNVDFEDAGNKVTVLGWGARRADGVAVERLQAAVLPMIEYADCLAFSPEDVQPGMICASTSDDGQGPCAGDDGGPALFRFGGRWVQIGIISVGNGCGSNCRPTVLTQLSAYSCWVKQMAPSASASLSACNATYRPKSVNDGVRASDAACDLASGVIGIIEKDVRTRFSCFPGDSLVELVSGERKAMSELEVGDCVRTSAGGFSDVYFFSHRDGESVRSDFVSMTTADGSTLVATSGHLIAVQGIGLTEMAELRTGMIVEGRSSDVRIVQVRLGLQRRGLYNPHTLDGTIVVNGITASCYTTALAPRIAQMALLPHRLAWRLLKPVATRSRLRLWHIPVSRQLLQLAHLLAGAGAELSNRKT